MKKQIKQAIETVLSNITGPQDLAAQCTINSCYTHGLYYDSDIDDLKIVEESPGHKLSLENCTRITDIDVAPTETFIQDYLDELLEGDIEAHWGMEGDRPGPIFQKVIWFGVAALGKALYDDQLADDPEGIEQNAIEHFRSGAFAMHIHDELQRLVEDAEADPAYLTMTPVEAAKAYIAHEDGPPVDPDDIREELEANDGCPLAD